MSSPRESLQITFVNPSPPSAGDWATDLVESHLSAGISLLDLAVRHDKGSEFPICAREWTQVLSPDDDTDLDPVGFSGWVLQPEISKSDLPFSHPFGPDWECMVALDPEYAPLLALGNRVPDGKDGEEAVQDAATLGIAVPDGGLMAVETDGDNVPSAFKAFDDHVRKGDRIAAFGRWIVDTGHAVDLSSPWSAVAAVAEVAPPLSAPIAQAALPPPAAPPTPGVVRDHRGGGGGSGGVSVGVVRDHRGDAAGAAAGGPVTGIGGPVRDHRTGATGSSYRAEVHPPLLMAVGGTRENPDGSELTRILLTSRPYLPTQVYTTDVDSIGVDSAGNDGTFLDHMNNEVDKLHGIIPSSTLIEAHPKIASKPFDGVHLFRLTVRPPAPAQTTPNAGRAEVLQVSFQLTYRTGVAVQVVPADGGVDLWISMNSVAYVPPPLPARHGERWTKERLDQLQSGAGDVITFEQVVSAVGLLQPGGVLTVPLVEYFISRGVETDAYDASDVDVLDRSHAVGWTSAGHVAPGAGLVHDDAQPFPIFGFVEARWVAAPDLSVFESPAHLGIHPLGPEVTP